MKYLAVSFISTSQLDIFVLLIFYLLLHIAQFMLLFRCFDRIADQNKINDIKQDQADQHSIKIILQRKLKKEQLVI